MEEDESSFINLHYKGRATEGQTLSHKNVKMMAVWLRIRQASGVEYNSHPVPWKITSQACNLIYFFFVYPYLLESFWLFKYCKILCFFFFKGKREERLNENHNNTKDVLFTSWCCRRGFKDNFRLPSS